MKMGYSTGRIARQRKAALFAGAFLALFLSAGCDSDKPARPDPNPAPPSAGIVVITSDYSTGSVAILNPRPSIVAPGPWFARWTDLAPACGDVVGRTHGGLLYLINRFGCDNIEVIDPATWTILREFSVGSGTNPQDIAVISASRAYVSRYETNLLLEVDPTTGAELGTISLEAFADEDGTCEMHRMQVRGNRLFVQVQRMDRRAFPWSPMPPSLLAVIDLDARELLDLDPATDGVQGIPLAGINPCAPFQVDPASGELLVPSSGAYGVIDEGGIERVDPVSGASLGFLVTEAELGGDLVDFTIWSATRGFAIVSTPEYHTILVAFDPTTGARTAILHDPGGFVLADCLVHSTGYLFVADRTHDAPGVLVFDAETGSAVTDEPIAVGLPPFELLYLPEPGPM